MMPDYPPPAEAPAVGREDARSRAAQIARNSYGRLLSIIAARTGDIELAEDALGDALLEALCRWPEQGIPSNPEAWILTVARNRGRDVLKSAHHNRSLPLAAAERKRARDVLEEFDPEAIPDDRLGLLFACAHPAIDPAARTPVMLQVVLGLDARLIARAFNVRHTTMAQRLVRAKRRIRNTGIPLAIPGQQEMHSRLLSVLEAIYAVSVVAERRAEQGEGIVLGEIEIGRRAPLLDVPEGFWLHPRGPLPSVVWNYQRWHGRRWYRRHVMRSAS